MGKIFKQQNLRCARICIVMNENIVLPPILKNEVFNHELSGYGRREN